MTLIEPRTLKGFRDYLPEAMIPRERLIGTAQQVYRSFGYSPIDTPALEYIEVLKGKGGDESDRLMYEFDDHGGRRVGMRFDLTVPLARFAAQHVAELGLPFKRYHIGSVWRGENTARGRYREFMQCDFDTIGTESVVSDIESVLVIHDLLRALGFERFTIRINSRQFLTSLLDALGFAERQVDVLRVLDKRDKVGEEGVLAELATLGFDPSRSKELLRRTGEGSDPEGTPRLVEVLEAVRAAGVGPERVRFDPTIARGLDYYTGIVFETRLDDQPEIGSVCSGGRYDDLAQLYTRERLPGVGASLGLDRLLAAIDAKSSSATAAVFLPFFDASRLDRYLRLAADLRAAGIGVELYPEAKKLGAQLKYADRRGFRFALVLGEDEWKSGTCQLKDLSSATTRSLATHGPDGKPSAELLAALQ